MTAIATRDGIRASHIIVPFSSQPPEAARLSFDNAVQNLRLTADAPQESLLEASFSEPHPRTWSVEGSVHVEYPRGSRVFRRVKDNHITLNPRLHWSIDIHGGVSGLDADLADLDIRTFECSSAAEKSRIVLGRPTEASTLRFTSLSDVRIERPDGVPVRLEIARSATRLEFVGASIGAIGGGFTNETEDYRPDQAGYLVVVSGSAHRLAIG